jgi:hypothetical protein
MKVLLSGRLDPGAVRLHAAESVTALGECVLVEKIAG